MGIMEKLFGKQEKVRVEEYEELDLSEFEAELEEDTETYIKVAEITSFNDIPEIRRQVYDGNIIIADLAFLKHDKLTLDRILKDLKQLAEDVKGDIVGLGEEYVIITPMGIKIDRNITKGRISQIRQKAFVKYFKPSSNCIMPWFCAGNRTRKQQFPIFINR